MSSIMILTVLKVTALVIALASTLWGMVAKTTVDGPDGRKKLTAAGQLAVVLACGSFLVAIATHGFETLAKQASASAAAAEAFRAEQREQRRDDEATRDRAQRRAAEAQAAAAAANQQLLALSLANRQRILTLTAENEQRLRDAAISRDVNLRARENLARTGKALGELERVLHPLGEIRMRLTVEIPLGARRSRLAEFALQARRDPSLLRDPRIDGHGLEEGRLNYITVRSSSELYPNASESEIRDFIGLPAAEVHFIPASELKGGAKLIYPEGGAVGGIKFRLRAVNPSLTYFIDRNSLAFDLSFKEDIELTGSVVSIPDLEKSMLAIDADPSANFGRASTEDLITAMRAGLRPIAANIEVAGRTYVIRKEMFRAVGSHGGYPLFGVLPPLRPVGR